MPVVTRSGQKRVLPDFYPATKRASSPSDRKEKVDDENKIEKENTPTKKSRQECQKEQDVDTSAKIIRAKRCLGLGRIAHKLVGRGLEMDTLITFIRDNVKHTAAASLYVSGMPGTGKTMCAKRAIETLQGDLDFYHVWINCMKVESLAQLYAQVCGSLEAESSVKGKRRTPGKIAASDLKDLLLSQRKTVVLCLDEVDQLQKSLPSALIKLFQLSASPGSNLVLIGIANSCDLVDRCLHDLNVNAGLKPRQLHFRPYNVEEVVAIVRERLLGYGDILDPQAIELCARKCAAGTGDVRKALETCKKAVEWAVGQRTEGSSSRCTTADIIAALHDVYAPMKATSRYAALPLQQRLLLASILSLSSHGCRQVTVSKIFEEYKRVCETSHVPAVGSSELHNLCSLLESNGLLRKLPKAVGGIKYKLDVDENAAREAINDDTLLSVLLGDKIHI